ncbi:DUF397 domain-containing protein [Thermopolyspora sp. NPDC052614]|uniref:DUF397 domain-containing protein n=1 Tax=Thermopolyspora sp. NPDC052614 TaxID=3155682 RepID=UPI00342E5518
MVVTDVPGACALVAPECSSLPRTASSPSQLREPPSSRAARARGLSFRTVFHNGGKSGTGQFPGEISHRGRFRAHQGDQGDQGDQGAPGRDRPRSASGFDSGFGHGDGEGVECAPLGGGKVGMRDSKRPKDVVPTFGAGEWRAVVTAM